MVELLGLTQCNNHFFGRIFARSVGDRCHLCDFRIPVQYNHTTQRAFSSSPDFRDFVIYHHSVSRRIETHWATVAMIDEGIASELEVECGLQIR